MRTQTDPSPAAHSAAAAHDVAHAPARNKRYRGLLKSVLYALLWSVPVLFLCLYIQAESLSELASLYLGDPVILLLNWLPVAVCAVFFTCLTGNHFAGLAITTPVFAVLNLIHVVKDEIRGEPLLPSDLFLFKEGAGAVGDFDVDIHPPVVLLIAVCTLVFVLLAVLPRVCAGRRGIRWGWGRVLGALLALVAGTGLFFAVYASSSIYQARLDAHLSTTEQYHFSSVYRSLGFNYSFLHFVQLYPVERPEGYDQDQVESWIADYRENAQLIAADRAVVLNSSASSSNASSSAASSSDTFTPSVIFVMNESFTDLSDFEAFAYSAQDDPLRSYKEVVSSAGTLSSGHVVVSNFGGGTANTEFDVTTGMKTNFIAQGEPTAFYVVHSALNSLFRVAADAGYHTVYLHPGYAWFYNRQNVFTWLGVEQTIFNTVFSDEDMMGGWITDEAFRVRMLNSLLNTLDAGTPYFGYGTTIQNHLQYDYSKYVYEGEESYDPVPLNVDISDEAMEQLSVYMRGVRDGSDMLKNLTDYLDTINEPVLLAYFGDHRPSLGTDYLAYRELGTDIGDMTTAESVVDTYSTPYVIWANAAYLEAVDIEATLSNVGLPLSASGASSSAATSTSNGSSNANVSSTSSTLSDNYLGEIMYELAGLAGSDPYFDFLGDARREVPVISHGVYGLSDGSLTTEPSDSVLSIAQQLRNWEYYRLTAEVVD